MEKSKKYIARIIGKKKFIGSLPWITKKLHDYSFGLSDHFFSLKDTCSICDGLDHSKQIILLTRDANDRSWLTNGSDDDEIFEKMEAVFDHHSMNHLLGWR